MTSFQRLSDREKRAVNTHRYHGMSVVDIAKIIGRHPSTVSTYIRAACVRNPTKKVGRTFMAGERLKKIFVKRAVWNQRTASSIRRELVLSVPTRRVQNV